jgi:hypothetical protein
MLIHHMPGWDEWIKEASRRLAYHGFATLAPHLNYFRDARRTGRASVSPWRSAPPRRALIKKILAALKAGEATHAD